MILEGAIGDTYGAGFEFADRSIIEAKNNLTEYIRHPKFDSIYKKYTDDTQMAIGIAELIVEGQDWTKEIIADKFVSVFRRDPREGYAKRFYALLMEIQTGTELLDRIVPKSERNGAAMRAYPIGVYSSEAEVIEKAGIQAQITHDSPKGILSAQAIALMAHYFFHKKGPKIALKDYLNDVQSYNWEGNWQGEVEINGIQSVEAVLTILINGKSLQEMLKDSIELGGDVDTVGSLVLAIGSCSDAYEKDLPTWLYEELEEGTYGKKYIEDLDQKLMNL